MPPAREINSPACILARLAFLLHLGSLLGAVVLAPLALVLGHVSALLLALALCGLAALLSWTLRRAGWYALCRQSFASLGLDDAESTKEADPVLGRLLARRDEIESWRGTSGFDPWALLSVKHEIEAHLRSRSCDDTAQDRSTAAGQGHGRD